MYKEIIIIFVVVILVIGLDVISNNYTKTAIEKLSYELDNLKIEILKENRDKSLEQMDKVQKVWRKKYKVMAYYIEHDELEKVETELTRLSANIEVEEYKHCIEEIETSIFILEHIKQKEKLDIISIF